MKEAFNIDCMAKPEFRDEVINRMNILVDFLFADGEITDVDINALGGVLRSVLLDILKAEPERAPDIGTWFAAGFDDVLRVLFTGHAD